MKVATHFSKSREFQWWTRPRVLRQRYKTLNSLEAGRRFTGLYSVWPKGEEYNAAKNPHLKNISIMRIPLMVFSSLFTVALLHHGEWFDDGIIISELLNFFSNFDQKRWPYPPIKHISLCLHKMKAKKQTMFELRRIN